MAAPGTDSDLLEGLNPVQREAVVHDEGPLLVIAGAGSGKTRVLTHRIAHLIRAGGVSPFEILAITFTNKAAEEMRERVGALVGPVAQKMWVSTFHSACVRILRRDADKLGYPKSFTIYDQADAVRLTGYVIRDLNLDTKRFPPRSVHAVDLGGQERPPRRRRVHRAGQRDLRAQDRRRLPGVPGPPAQGRGHGLRRPALGHRHPVPAATPTSSSTTAAGSATCSSTSTRTPTRSRTSSSSSCPPSTATSASSATPTSACRPARWSPRPRASVPIEEVAVGDEVIGTGGDGRQHTSVGHPRPARALRGPALLGEGRRARCCAALRTTSCSPTRRSAADQHVVYLMERLDRGFRIGRRAAPDSRPSRARSGAARRSSGLRSRGGRLLGGAGSPPTYGLPVVLRRARTQQTFDRGCRPLDLDTRTPREGLAGRPRPPPRVPARRTASRAVESAS